MPEESQEIIYTHEGREELLEEDEITDLEEGFTEGYENGDTEIKCPQCGKMLTNEQVVERELRGQTYYFCSISCAETYVTKKKNSLKTFI